VLTGRRVSLDSIGRLVYAVRTIVPEVVVFDYRSAVPDTGASTVFRLGEAPMGARDALLARLERAAAKPRAPLAPAAAAASAHPVA
jgi:MerR family transcriptional regulator, light-induced transcriptional regulator